MQHKIACHKKLAYAEKAAKFEREAKASRQQDYLLTTALLNEIRVSTSVGGGGRERWNPSGTEPAQAGKGNDWNAADELGTRRCVTPKVTRYQERFGFELERSVARLVI